MSSLFVLQNIKIFWSENWSEFDLIVQISIFGTKAILLRHIGFFKNPRQQFFDKINGTSYLGSIFQIEIVLIFLFAGIIKGLIGLGVPMITLSLMSLFQPVPSAVVITLLPGFLTNVWQGAKGGNFIKLSKKLWGLIVMVPPGVWIGTYFLDKFEVPWFSVILGSLLV